MFKWFWTIFSLGANVILHIPLTIIWACMEVGERNKPSTGIKALPSLGPLTDGNESNAKKIPISPKLKLNGDDRAIYTRKNRTRLK